MQPPSPDLAAAGELRFFGLLLAVGLACGDDGNATSSGAMTESSSSGDVSSTASSGDQGTTSGASDASSTSDTGSPPPNGGCGRTLFVGDPVPGRSPRSWMAGTQSHLVFSSAAGLEVFDATDPPFLTSVGELSDIDLPGRRVAMEGEIAVLHHGTAVVLVDLSSPSTPAVLSRWTDESGVLAADLAGDRLAVRTGAALELYDISQPDAPVLLASTEHARDCVVCPFDLSPERLFVVDVAGPQQDNGTATLRVWDVSDDTLAEGDAFSLGAHSFYAHMTVAADRTRALLAMGGGVGGSLTIVDTAAPASPVLVGQTPFFGGRTLAVSGSSAVSISGGWVTTFDVTEVPIELGAASRLEGAGARALVFTGNRVTGFPGLANADVSDLANPSPLPALRLPFAPASVRGDGRAAAVLGDLVLLADADGGLRVFDASDRENPIEIGRLQTARPTGFVTEGGRAWVEQGERNGWNRVDLEDPSAPSIGPVLSDGSGGVESFSGDLYVKAGSEVTIEVFDGSGGNVGTPVATIAPEQATFFADVVIAGDLLVAINTPGASFGPSWVYDLADPTSPTLVATLEGEMLRPPLMAVGDHLLIDRELVSLEDPSNPTVVATLPAVDGAVGARAFDDGFLFEAVNFVRENGSDYDAVVSVYDLRDPSSPQLVTVSDPIPTELLQFDASGGLLAYPMGERYFGLIDARCGS